MNNENMKSFFCMLIVIRIKITMGYNFTPIRMAKIKKDQ